MEGAALNKAHLEHRRADLHLKHRKFLEAVECHKKAYDYLGEALTCTSHVHAIESINEQRKYHLQQTKLIAVKKEQFENCKRALENRPRTNSTSNGEFENAQESDSTSLQVAIYRNMEEADYLLDSLIKGGIRGNSDSESLKSFSTTDTDDKIASIENLENGGLVVGNKHPKNDSTVIEELRTLNDQLRSLVYRLVMQLDASKREVDTLKERIKQLETEKGKAQSRGISTNLKVVTDSSGGTSPYVVSPISEQSPDIQGPRSLPPLPRLEMPPIDFKTFMTSSSTIDTGN